MAHYALINKDDIVVQVITGIDENIIQTDLDGTQIGGSSEAWEQFYQSRPWFEGLYCKRTSYNGKVRKNYAGIGYTYSSQFDAFIPPKPFDSWSLDHNTYQWLPPIPKPKDEENYLWKWSEFNKEWIQVEIHSV